MHPAHLPQVLEIERRAYAFPWTEGIFRDCLKTGYSAWVLTNTLGEVQAYALMSMAVGEAHVLNLCVDPQRQRSGLGRQLLDHLITLARAAHCTQVLLEVRKSNKAAFRLYETRGFERIGLRKGYYPALDGREDAIVLSLELV
ncbi:MAG: ribosomal-protein-alanine N-acetyltransferase [Nevskiaceae bacterium]|nr:MAG: ribosomal-protein-alanine N-acetyltransferase [Nevskiaceae bacterium]